MSKLETNQVDPATGTTLTLGTSGDTITIPSGVTIANSGTATGFGGANTPAFSVIMSADQTGIGDNVETKVDFDTEEYDTNSSYDVSNQRFTVPSGSAGKYQFSACVAMSGTNCGVNNVKLYKNGSGIRWSRHNHIGGDAMDDVAINLVCTLSLAESDYIEIYAYSNVTSGTVSFLSDSSGNERSYFCGNKLIG